jgi:hypothetical protein
MCRDSISHINWDAQDERIMTSYYMPRRTSQLILLFLPLVVSINKFSVFLWRVDLTMSESAEERVRIKFLEKVEKTVAK